MLESKINNERNMQDALNSLNLFLEKKEQTYYFKVEYRPAGLDLILVKHVYYPNYHGYVDRYILSTETPLKMGAEIIKIYALLLNIKYYIIEKETNYETLYTLPNRKTYKQSEKSRAFPNDRGCYLHITKESL